MILTNGRIFNGRKFLKKNTVVTVRNKISGIYYVKQSPEGSVDLKGKILAPGLIDMHTHAAAHMDFLGVKNDNDINKIRKAYLGQGVTSFLATTLFSGTDKKRASVIRKIQNAKTGARCLGVYLEGPFISLVKKGAIPGRYIIQSKIQNPKSKIRSILKIYPKLKMMTVAPELPGAEAIIKYLRKKGIIASFGHSNAGQKETKQGIKWGIRNTTHLFNGMRKWNDEDPSYKALLRDKRVTVELISDGRHVPPEILRMVYKKFGRDRIALVSDATGGRGYYDAAREVGTNLPLLELARRMKRFCGLSNEETLQMITSNPARVLGFEGGEVKVGGPAEFIILDDSLRLLKVVSGRLSVVGSR
jgi:N-acetylglucosamine-6-phosphate deacetylase